MRLKPTSKLGSLATYFLPVEPEIISKGMTVLNFQNPDVRARNPRKFAGGWRQRRGEGEPGGGMKFGERRAGEEDSGSVQKRHGKTDRYRESQSFNEVTSPSLQFQFAP